jgi:hypothetical protein
MWHCVHDDGDDEDLELEEATAAVQRELQRALPEGWQSALDPSSGNTYYIETATMNTTWNKPIQRQPQRDVVDRVAAPASRKDAGYRYTRQLEGLRTTIEREEEHIKLAERCVPLHKTFAVQHPASAHPVRFVSKPASSSSWACCRKKLAAAEKAAEEEEAEQEALSEANRYQKMAEEAKAKAKAAKANRRGPYCHSALSFSVPAGMLHINEYGCGKMTMQLSSKGGRKGSKGECEARARGRGLRSGDFHRASPNCATWPIVLTENPY